VERTAAVVDMVYAGHTTALARYATDSGVVLSDGKEMLLHQGFAQFAAFTGRLPPKDAMRKALEDVAL
jgi:shikimate dehydrogenase